RGSSPATCTRKTPNGSPPSAANWSAWTTRTSGKSSTAAAPSSTCRRCSAPPWATSSPCWKARRAAPAAEGTATGSAGFSTDLRPAVTVQTHFTGGLAMLRWIAFSAIAVLLSGCVTATEYRRYDDGYYYSGYRDEYGNPVHVDGSTYYSPAYED